MIPVTTDSPLIEALRLVHENRRADYGAPKDNHGRTAELWTAYLGVAITPRQVCMLNILQKVSRDAHKPLPDNLTDIAGYIENIYLCEKP